MVGERTIEESEAIVILQKQESHFFDFASKFGDGKNIVKKCAAFANADGGEIFVGIRDSKDESAPPGPLGRWEGFATMEDANGIFQTIHQNITPNIEGVTFEFMQIRTHSALGKMLRIDIEKSASVHRITEGKVFLRRNASCVELAGQEILNLQLSKGTISFEDQFVGAYNIKDLETSSALYKFLQEYSPKTEPVDFLKKQKLIRDVSEEKSATYAGVLLYDENPSISLPKKCAIKIVRYNTSEVEPEREHLERSETIEGPLMEQINQSISVIQSMIESVPIMGTSGLEKAKYPPEAIKEILVNAIIHRDYNISDDVLVLIFNNRIEVQSPGILPGHITTKNILTERFSRNPKIVRLLNKYPNPPNKDIGEGLNTAYQKMRERQLKDPHIEIVSNKVVVTLPHQPLASPEETILEYLKTNKTVSNSIIRKLTGIKSENLVKNHFYALRDRGLITRVPGLRGNKSEWTLVDSGAHD